MTPAPYTIIAEDDQDEADDIEGALQSATAMYDPSKSVPEIVDAKGNVVFDQSEVAARILERIASHRR